MATNALIFLNLLFISSCVATHLGHANGSHSDWAESNATTHRPLLGHEHESASGPRSLGNNGYLYPFSALLSLNTSANESHPTSSEGPTIFLNATASPISSPIHGSHQLETINSGLNSAQSSSSSLATASTGIEDGKNHRETRGAYDTQGGHHGPQYQGYEKPQYHGNHYGCAYEKTTTTTPAPRKVIICIIDGKVVELEDPWTSCPTTTTTVAPKHHLEHKPLEHKPLEDKPLGLEHKPLKPVNETFKLPDLFHH